VVKKKHIAVCWVYYFSESADMLAEIALAVKKRVRHSKRVKIHPEINQTWLDIKLKN